MEPEHLHGSAPKDTRPADILVSPSTHSTDKQLALDVSIVSPDNVTPLNSQRATQQYKVATQKERAKLTEYENFLKTLTPPITPATSDYEKMPLVMESTGAWGPSMQRWWALMIKADNDEARDQAGMSRRSCGPTHTRSANSFTTWWARRISVYMRHLGEEILKTTAVGPYSHFNA